MNITNKTTQVIALVGVSSSVFALEPMPVKVGEAGFVPTLDVSVTSDSNIRANNTNKQSATVTSIAPKFLFGAETRNTAYQLEYGINHRKFDGADVGDLTDQRVAGRAMFDFDVRNKMKLEATHDRRESIENLLNQNTNPNGKDRIATNRLAMDYFFGAPQATINTEFGINYNQLRSIDSNVNQNMERDTTGMNASLLYRISPITQLELEGRYATTDYLLNDTATKAKNNNQRTILAGVRWEVSALTTGRAKAGYETRSFTNTNRPDAERPSWEVAIDWTPLTYSKFTFLTQQATQEGNLGFAFVETARSSVTWQHEWTPLFKTSLSYARVAEDFANSPVDPNRSDASNQASILLNYALKRWIDLNAGYVYSDRDSVVGFRQFSRDQWRVGISMSL